MTEIEHRVGISATALYPRNLFMSPARVGGKFLNADAEFMVHQPGWNNSSMGLTIPVSSVESSWWIDRDIEFHTPLQGTWKNAPINLGICSFLPISNRQTKEALRSFPSASLINRWADYSPETIKDPKRAEIARRRNKVITRWSEGIGNKTEYLDVHPNIGLTPEELLNWQKEKPGRRLMISALDIDERLGKYGIETQIQHNLVAPLLGKVSAVNLKFGDLKDSEGKVVMNETEIIDAIYKDDMFCPYALRLKKLSEVVGSELPDSFKINWIIKPKPWYLGGSKDARVKSPDFLKRYVGFVKEVVK